MFISLMRFLLYSLVWSSFFVLLRNTFFNFSFSPSVQITFFSFFSFIPSAICRLPLFNFSMAHFSMPNFIPISSLYIITNCIRVSNSFSFFGKQFHVVHVRYVIDFCCNLVSLYRLVHLLSMWFSGIIVITNSIGDDASSLRIFSWFSPQLSFFPPVVRMVLSINDFVRYLVHREAIYYPALWDHTRCLFAVNPRQSLFFFSSRLAIVEYVLINVLLVPLRHRFCSSGNSPRFISEPYISPWLVFSSSSRDTLWISSSIPSAICRLPIFIISMAYFFMPNSIPISSLYMLYRLY